ncbi:MAG TPA: hypothetical protein ENN84_03655 [Candidatus Marinimicrobia bacterium]|nr:hypothetical protein [Candidatus Neomarinimicrobiota bacterium]
MGTNFSDAAEREAFIQEKFKDLLDQIQDNYGRAIMEKLMERLDRTLIQFDEDVRLMLESLEKREEAYVAALPQLDAVREQFIAKERLEQENRIAEEAAKADTEAEESIEAAQEEPDDPDLADKAIIERLMKRQKQ